MSDWRERLLSVLEERGLSMREVSVASGCSHSYLSKVLSLGNDPSLQNILAIADYLNISISWLLTGVEASKQSEDFARLYSSLTPEQQERVLRLLQSMVPQSPK
jgi:transcriptional regulator with XRE-family HTH domain